MCRRISPILLVLLTFPPLLAQEQWEKTRSMAQSHHEIIMLLIEKQEFAKIPSAAKELFSLDFPEAQQPLLVEEARLLTDALLHKNQMAIAHQVLEDAIAASKTNSAKAQLFKEKAYVFKKEGKTDEAMKAFQRSVDLEKSGGS